MVCLNMPHNVNLASILVALQALPGLVARQVLHWHHPLQYLIVQGLEVIFIQTCKQIWITETRDLINMENLFIQICLWYLLI